MQPRLPPHEDVETGNDREDGSDDGSADQVRPDAIRFADALPKTRSGKIMRRLLGELATGGAVKGDTTTLEDFSVIAKLKEQDEA